MDNHQTVIGTWKEDLRLYVHVPFCVKKCDYCDFLSGSSNEKGIKSYFDALYKEIRSYKDRASEYRVSSIFIGGGTPSCVHSDYIVRTLDELEKVFEFTTEIKPEITIEVNPGTIDENKLMDYKKAGINRLSFGLQTSHDNELKLLGRIHSFSQFEENYKLARQVGFNNINIDLMSALPGQSLASWEKTLFCITKLKPEHISAYSLIIEEGTPFYDRYGPEGEDKDKLPSEEVDRLIYSRTKEILSSYGYERYEISNYAKEGYECRHNKAYWEGVSYLGLGLGSASLIDYIRFSNTNFLTEYINLINGCHNNIMSTNVLEKDKNRLLDDFYGIRRNIIYLTKNQQIEEFMFLGLRTSEGVSKSKFFKRFAIAMDDIYGDLLLKLEKDGLVTSNKDKLYLTDYGIDVSNRVLSEFLFE
ncbi:MAG: radical SAM family heme chaperone HemW [Anaerolineaceae bacterium]|nr:MAG: radical SAM family heme chaperone HemW [Anaerolineaceae bacterium]